MKYHKVFLLFIVLALFSLILFGCAQKQEEAGKPAAEKKAEPQASEKAGGEEVAVIETDFGKIVFKFYEKRLRSIRPISRNWPGKVFTMGAPSIASSQIS